MGRWGDGDFSALTPTFLPKKPDTIEPKSGTYLVDKALIE